jgi:hypothetical protein
LEKIIGNYKILWQGCGIAFVVPFTILIIVTCKINNPKVIQVKVKPHNPPIVFDFSGYTKDDDVRCHDSKSNYYL